MPMAIEDLDVKRTHVPPLQDPKRPIQMHNISGGFFLCFYLDWNVLPLSSFRLCYWAMVGDPSRFDHSLIGSHSQFDWGSVISHQRKASLSLGDSLRLPVDISFPLSLSHMPSSISYPRASTRHPWRTKEEGSCVPRTVPFCPFHLA